MFTRKNQYKSCSGCHFREADEDNEQGPWTPQYNKLKFKLSIAWWRTKFWFSYEEFEDTKGAIGIRISKNRQHNDQKKKYKRTNTSRSFPRSLLITGFVTRLTRRVSLVEQELPTLPEHLSSPSVFSEVRVTRSLVVRCETGKWNLNPLYYMEISSSQTKGDENLNYVWMTINLVEQELPTLPEHLSSLSVFSEVRVTRSLVVCACFVDRCLSLCPFSFGHCVVCPASIYHSDYPFGIFRANPHLVASIIYISPDMSFCMLYLYIV
jgi:hypothetical protein